MPGEGQEHADFIEARAGLVLGLRQLGITDPALLRAFETVPHEFFVPQEFLEYAYREVSLPIPCGQSITSPSLVGQMLKALEPQGVHKVLEVGTGSGYCAAVLSRLARRVFTLERYRQLVTMAKANWDRAGLTNVVGLHEDGLNGLTQQAPFDRILVTGSIEEMPEGLLDQLSDGGIALAPIGAPSAKQVLVRYERADDAFVETEHGAIRLAPLTPGRARAL